MGGLDPTTALYYSSECVFRDSAPVMAGWVRVWRDRERVRGGGGCDRDCVRKGREKEGETETVRK